MFTRTRGPTSSSLVRRSTRPFAVVALCAAFVAGAPATAQAQTVDDVDTVGDMVMGSDTDDGWTLVPVPERKVNDVSNTTLKHGARRVGIEVDYVDLKKRLKERQSLFIKMRTNEGARRYVSLDTRGRHWLGKTQMYSGKYVEFSCAVRHSIDYEANAMKVSFPRACLSNPRWVKFRVDARVFVRGAFYADDALRDRPTTADDRRLARSDRVYRETAN